MRTARNGSSWGRPCARTERWCIGASGSGSRPVDAPVEALSRSNKPTEAPRAGPQLSFCTPTRIGPGSLPLRRVLLLLLLLLLFDGQLLFVVLLRLLLTLGHRDISF